MTEQPRLSAKIISEVIASKRFLAADRAKMSVSEIATYDRYLNREHRLLVPIDVQALYVPEGDTEKMVRLPMLLAGPGGTGVSHPAEGMPELFAEGSVRPPGVHLHWAMPDALLRGRMAEPTSGDRELGLPILPDRWVVLRLIHPRGASTPQVTGWVLLADRAVAISLTDWREDMVIDSTITPAGEPLAPEQLTGTVGGSPAWASAYDAVTNRFAFHDPLTDLLRVAPGGVDSDSTTYVVSGWWRNPRHDPLDAARSSDSLHELLLRLRWRLLYEWGDAAAELDRQRTENELRRALGLPAADGWDSRPVTSRGPRLSRRGEFAGLDPTKVEDVGGPISSAFTTAAAETFKVTNTWQLRACLLHGSVFGVPVTGAIPVDHRPGSASLDVACGEHDDDVLAAFAAAGQTAAAKRTTERLLTAFTSQKISTFGSADGVVAVEEHEHSSGFSSVHGGIAGTDRYLQRVQTGGVGGLQVGRHKARGDDPRNDPVRSKSAAAGDAPAASPMPDSGARAPRGLDEARLTMSFGGKYDLVAASELTIFARARSRVGDVLTATSERVVRRPAARFSMPDDPMLAIRGLRRSLRHGNDGRGSPDAQLTCRWPSHAITEISGIIDEDRLIPTLGTGSVPREVLRLAREAMLIDPYHDTWLAAAVSGPGADQKAIARRLVAESMLRFGTSGSYDGTTVMFQPTFPATPAARRNRAAAPARLEPGIRQQQLLVNDEAHRYSLYAGADPDLVGVTAWSQPWIPTWLEWEVQVDGLDPASIDDWELGPIDLDRSVTTATPEGQAAVLRGRSLLTTGGAATLHAAIRDWLKAEDAGVHDEADDDVEASLRTLAEAVEHLDVATVALDGFRHQLLGFDCTDGLLQPADDGTGTSRPAPMQAPRALLAGRVRLLRARLVDAYGRTLEVPVDQVRVPNRLADPGEPGVLAASPRLLRPARWQFRLVAASTPAGVDGLEARVDEVDPDLQVNPVAGFLLPDHLDESLEVLGVNGSPLGELLHEPVSGGVLWEIAPGREGPADSGPHYGLDPEQAALGRLAAGLVAADAAARHATTAAVAGDPPAESALSALLRAIDTTLWSVDSMASLGTEHVAGLVGRPIAVVRAQLELQLQPPDDVDLSDPDLAAEWAAAAEGAAKYAFSVRLGEVTRSDDGVLGFFVDDDYTRFRLVDKAIAGAATEAGRSRGQLGLYAARQGLPDPAPLSHPYLAGTDDADTLRLHLGQRVTLTILMHPGGKATFTSGVLPRRAIALARNWVADGLAAMAPSLRTGPVLVETDLDPGGEVRLPKVSVFGKDQNFLWRDTPATWRTDAILAATQTALLPDTPAEFREGWIRVAPPRTEIEGPPS